ncbi:heme ABC exporter ATP-binding protein CcmA [Jannaschia sp. S6380]|uniref:heme ABC exporter ATP-binding protein CcmA n=1 Tax=Jannaschia sp. S6380 TaxID=2926408 RepID=UPI001FF59B8F|nr:heme ABC exporter ATP-binding protein CcmA [Jannaschia sp. S6380]MCK0166134.1 heme ABC exporter ATP-binding protein CcmA [Jannaschia sp. S6380]
MDLDVVNLTCRRGETIVLRDVAVTVAAGTALILRGPNGSGKTTLLRTLAGLTPPVTGRAPPSDTVAYAAHSDGLKAQLTVAENLDFWARIFGARDLVPAIAAFDLGDLLPRRVADLSAGQKRRTSLARLPLTGRPIWLLDEPTVSLDAANVARFAAAVSAHLVQGGCAILATHIDLGLPQTRSLDVSTFAETMSRTGDDPFAEAVE